MLNNNSRKSSRERSISRNLTIGLIVTILVVSTLTISLNLFIASQRAKAQLEDKADEYITSLTEILEVPLWNLTRETIEHIGAFYSHDELVEEIKITDNLGKIYFDKETEQRASLVSRTRDVFYQDRLVGYVKISLTPSYYKEINRQLLWSSIFIILINLLSLLIMTKFLLRTSLEKPLKQLGKIVNSYATGQYGSTGQHTPYVEFQSLITVLDEMGDKIIQTQEQLVRKERLAVLGQLAGGVSHELRTPLGAISNATYFLDMVLEEPTPEVQEALGILTRKVKTAEKIINSLLDVARDKPPARREIDLNHVVQEALSSTAVPERVEVTAQLDETIPTILADPDQLVQVFGNLILNAAQAMPEGGRLAIRSQISEPGWVSVSISDTGVGIPPKNLDKLFEPLFTTKAQGIGLGLALVKSLIERHGGKIEVQSQVGQGSVLTVILPIREE
jgi:signal transduction histidine kinase